MRAWTLPLLLAGCAAPPEDRVPGLIDALGHEDAEVRTLALGELRRLGPVAALREGARRPDVEIAARCAELLAELERASVDAWAKVVVRVVRVEGDTVFIEAADVVDLRLEICREGRRLASAEFLEYTEGGAKLRITTRPALDLQPGDLAVGF